MCGRVVRLLWMAAVIALPGCGGKPAVPPVKPATTPAPAKATVAADTPQPATKMPEAVVVKAEPKDDAASLPAAESPSKTADPPTGKPAEKPAEKIPARPERIAVLTPGGPLLIDIALSMDGQSHADLFAARIQQVLDAADTDHDHQNTWSELAANEEFLKAERALNPNTPKKRTKAWTEQYDLNRDKQVQAKEAAAWLGRDASRSVAAFSLRSRRAYYSVPSLASRVWQLLDIDNDGRLTAEELAAAPERFLSLDANDDRIITRAEMAPLREQLSEAGQPPLRLSRDADRYAALHLEPPGDIDRLEYLLADLYAPRQPLSPSSFPDLPQLFEQLDANNDSGLDQEELAKLLTIKPHLDLAITFDKPAEEGNRGDARVEVRGHSPEVDVLAQPAPNRVVFSLSNTRIIVSASDLAVAGPAEMAGERGALRVMVHDDFDALFETLDSNADGRLGEQETTTSPARMLTRDKNGDGELTSSELPTAMIVAFLRSERPNEQSFYVPEDTATPRPTGTPLGWFAQADFNGDGAVSRREFLGSLEQFTHLDANRDGFINAEEATAAVTHESSPEPNPASTTPKDSPK